ncbi:MAG: flagellin lysine-N-methylase [Eubacteriales bacterium]|nr:flagellin lysine-N-methylase [Eubacteriales bacterium]
MEYVYPEYFYEFRCVGKDCTDTCCQAWEIGIDPVSLRKYRDYPGFFGNRLRNSIDWRRGVFEQYGGRCAFLNEDNLCDIYTEAGKGMLCKACTRYPRHYEEYENLREISLSLSCPEAARMILGKKEPLRFHRSFRRTPEEEYEIFDLFLFSRLRRIRRCFFGILQSREISVGLRLSFLLALSHDLQPRIDRDRYYSADRILKKCGNERFLERAVEKLRRYEGNAAGRAELLKEMFGRMYRMEALDPGWHGFLKECSARLCLEAPKEEYGALCAEFSEYMKEREHEYEQLLVYLIFTYFCGAVYDRDAFGKVKLAACVFLMTRELGMACWLGNGKVFSFGEQVRLCARLSREIEHQACSLDMLEHMLREEQTFSLEAFLGAVLA